MALTERNRLIDLSRRRLRRYFETMFPPDRNGDGKKIQLSQQRI